MCLAIPARVTKLMDGGMALADVGGVSRPVSLSLVDDVKVGDYIIVHVGFALSKLDPEEAAKTLALFDEMNAAGARDRAEKAGKNA